MKWVVLLGGLLIAGVAQGQIAPVPLPCDAKDFAKGVDSYRVVTAKALYVNCGRTNLLQFDTAAALYLGVGGDRKRVEDVTASVRLFKPEDPWIRIDFVRTGGAALVKDQDYELDIAPNQLGTIVVNVDGQKAPVAGPFEKLTIGFSTKPNATVRPGSISSLGAKFDVFSNLALKPFNQNGPKFAEISALRTRIYHNAKTVPKGAMVSPCAAGAMAIIYLTNHNYSAILGTWKPSLRPYSKQFNTLAILRSALIP